MIFEIKKATRQGIKPLIGLYGKSGGGKTFSALMLARGIVGEEGKITLIDTENGRGSIFADVIPGGYDTISFDAPFTSERYMEAIKVAEAMSDIIVIDSMTHEWDGEGGVLERQEAELTKMAGQDFKKRDACNMVAWNKAKFPHKKMVAMLLRLKTPIICCLRGSEKVQMSKNEKGKTVITTTEHCLPIYDKNFIFEMLINGEVYSKEGVGGYLRITKITHGDLFNCLPKKEGQISLEHGKAIAEWCASAGEIPEPKAKPVKELKAKLWNLTKEYHKEDVGEFEKWMKDNNLIEKEESVTTLNADRLETVIDMTEIKLAELKGVS